MKIRFYDEKGNQIKTPIEPGYYFRNNTREQRPPDFVIVKQVEIEKVTTDPFGQPITFIELTEPVEEIYCRWEFDSGTWYCLVSFIVRKNAVIKDCRPTWWKFYEKFNENRPRFV